VVHIQQFWDVCQCGTDEGDERTGRISLSIVLLGVWDYGYLFEPRERHVGRKSALRISDWSCGKEIMFEFEELDYPRSEPRPSTIEILVEPHDDGSSAQGQVAQSMMKAAVYTTLDKTTGLQNGITPLEEPDLWTLCKPDTVCYILERISL